MNKVIFSDSELEEIKMHIVHSSTGWFTKVCDFGPVEEPNKDTLALLKKVDFALGEPNVYDKDYGYSR